MRREMSSNPSSEEKATISPQRPPSPFSPPVTGWSFCSPACWRVIFGQAAFKWPSALSAVSVYPNKMACPCGETSGGVAWGACVCVCFCGGGGTFTVCVGAGFTVFLLLIETGATKKPDNVTLLMQCVPVDGLQMATGCVSAERWERAAEMHSQVSIYNKGSRDASKQLKCARMFLSITKETGMQACRWPQNLVSFTPVYIKFFTSCSLGTLKRLFGLPQNHLLH